MLQTAWQPGSS